MPDMNRKIRHIFVSLLGAAVAWTCTLAQGLDADLDVGMLPAGLIFPIEADSSSKASIIRLAHIFPFGTNFTVTSLDFLSRTAPAQPSNGALYFDNQMGLFRSQESLRQFLGGSIRLRVTVVSAETGIQTAEELLLPIIDKTFRLKFVSREHSQLVEENKFGILAQLKNTVDVKGKNLEFIWDKRQRSGKFDQSGLCFYVVEAKTGFPISAREILSQLQRETSDLMAFFYEKYQIQRISDCNGDILPSSAVSTIHMDGLSIGLLVLAIALSIFLIAAIIFLCSWMRMKKLHAAVIAAQHPLPANVSSEFTPPKFLTSAAPLSVSQWSALSLPTFSFGMPAKSGRPAANSVEDNYEWQESSLDLAGDAESINRSINEAVLAVQPTSSSAPSLTEDSPREEEADNTHL